MITPKVNTSPNKSSDQLAAEDRAKTMKSDVEKQAKRDAAIIASNTALAGVHGQAADGTPLSMTGTISAPGGLVVTAGMIGTAGTVLSGPPPVIPMQNRPLTNVEVNPSNWEIGQHPDQPDKKIVARNTVTGRTFEGTTKEFSKLLRGY